MRSVIKKLSVVCLLLAVLYITIFLSTTGTWTLPRVLKELCGFQESRNIVFLKVHKTGSSTIANILQRIGLYRSLNFALPNKTRGEIRFNYFGPLGGTLETSGIKPSIPERKEYNILYNHVVFNKKSFEEIFPRATTVYVTMLREPVAQFKSALLFFQHKEIYEAATSNMSSYLTNPAKFEPESPFLSFTNNRQALDLGLSPNWFQDEAQIRLYISVVEKAFDLVMITEHFDESLILLKRKMNWSFKDILYIRKNKAYKTFQFNLNSTDTDALKGWLFADILMYDYFNERFMNILWSDFTITEETDSFKCVLQDVQRFCSTNSTQSKLYIQGSPWNSPFYVTSLDCVYMMMGELDFLSKLLHV